MAATLINAFEVPPDADEAFLDLFERARDFLAGRGAYREPRLHRALRPDADFRFVNVATVDSADEWAAALADSGFPGAGAPFPNHPGLYEVAFEQGAPDGAEGVVLVNAFEVPADADERFLPGWHAAREVLSAEPGFLGTRLHRSPGPADLRFVNIARWSSPLAFAKAAGQPRFQEMASALPFASHNALYEVIRS